MRLVSCVVGCALVVTAARADDPKPAAAVGQGSWATIKGQVVFPRDKEIPDRKALNVNADRNHCLSKGPILDETILVNPRNRGIRNVVVFLRPLDTSVKAFDKAQIHPDDAKRKPAEITITQPCCMFVSRITLARVGDTVVVKNPAPVAHNFYWSSGNNGESNITIPAGDKHTFEKPLVAEASAIPYKCTIHPWMSGIVRVFDHPYHALTDDDGQFEIKNAPVGKFRIVFWHENGVRGGARGRFGEEIEIKGPAMVMKPTEFDVSPGKN